MLPSHIKCPKCGTRPVEVYMRKRPRDSGSIHKDWQHGAVKSVCIGCGRFFGYRPAKEDEAKKHQQQVAKT